MEEEHRVTVCMKRDYELEVQCDVAREKRRDFSEGSRETQLQLPGGLGAISSHMSDANSTCVIR